MTTQKVQITITNVNDGVVTGNQPTNPANGELWLDSSVTPNPMLKKWDGTQWNDVGELDPTLSTSLNTINTQLNNMTNDGIIDFTERKQVKQNISNIIGYVIADTATTLPTTATLDASGAGSFYQVRKSATQAGVSTSDTTYTALTTAYNDLVTYLDGLTPLPWDAGQINRSATITVDATTWRTKWMNYYSAEDVLRTTTSTQLKANVTNINIGGRNLLTGTNFDSVPAVFGSPTVTQAGDTPTNNIQVTSPASAGSGIIVGNRDATITSGQQYTLSFLALVGTQTGGTPANFNYVYLMSASQGNTTLGNVAINTANKTTYQLCTLTFTATKTMTDGAILIGMNNTYATTYSIKAVKLEQGNKQTDWTPAPEDADGQINDLQTRMSNTETAIEPNNITNTVISTDTFAQTISGKANSSDLANYATQDQLTQAGTNANTYTDNAIKNQDFSNFVQNTTFNQTVDGIDTKISKGGGVNLVKNSVGLSGTDMYTVTGTVITVQNDELTSLGFLSGFSDNGAVAGTLSQTIYTQIGQYYTISFYMKKTADASTNGTLGIYIYDANNTQLHFVGLDSGQGTTTGYQQYTYTFLANTATHTIKPTWGSSASGVITGIMVNIGVNALQWTMATGELYNANIKMDLNGITVSQNLNGIETGRTVMTPTKFAGYYDVNNDGVIDESDGSADEVFRMDKDEFVMKKATITSEITMGGIKVVQLNSGAINGWAFVKYTTQ